MVVPLAASESPPPWHEWLLNALSGTDGVVPPQPPVHPFRATFNPEAIIPPQCYTKTEGRHNPCYVCHQNTKRGRANVMNDGDLQLEYSFSAVGQTNHWRNLFEDRQRRMAQVSDADIIDWINQDNYSALPGHLEEAGFSGWIPDLNGLQRGAAAFDADGFAKDGSHWVAFNYKPMPSTFWPTNGAADDVMIRLPAIYRETADGRYSRNIYQANLAVLEGNIKGLEEVSTLPIDERAVEVDLDRNGRLGTARAVRAPFAWVGGAAGHFIDTHIYPQGVEFLHTLRYLSVDEAAYSGPSTRMKEVRYLRKWRAYGRATLARHYAEERFAKEAGNLPSYHLMGDYGIDNGSGWAVQSFIEGAAGQLRAATYEENLFCMGCHGSIGATIDQTFSFPRKVDGAAGWGYVDLKGMPDTPNLGETRGEILTYLERAGGGGEFRNNPEMEQRWFTEQGLVDAKRVAAADVHELVAPSRRRALALNKAYRTIVEDQDFIYGRDAVTGVPQNVYRHIDNRTAPTLDPKHFHPWDIRLDWSQ